MPIRSDEDCRLINTLLHCYHGRFSHTTRYRHTRHVLYGIALRRYYGAADTSGRHCSTGEKFYVILAYWIWREYHRWLITVHHNATLILLSFGGYATLPGRQLASIIVIEYGNRLMPGQHTSPSHAMINEYFVVRI